MFDIPKFDGKMNFNIWKFQMMAVLTQNGLKKALAGEKQKSVTMICLLYTSDAADE